MGMEIDEKKLKAAKTEPWSYSMVKDFDTCPKQYYHKRILKEIPFVETEQIRYGNEFHKAVELYINDEIALPKHFEFAKEAVDKLLTRGDFYVAEIEGAVTEDSVPTRYWGSDAWYRAKVDLFIRNQEKKIGYAIDWKTGGNPNYADPNQLEANSLILFRKYPEIDKIKGGLFFVLKSKLLTYEFHKKDYPQIWSKWVKKHKRVVDAHKTGVFNPRPSGLCKKHCPVTDCPYNGAN